ncbi:MAG: POTRA domain-containing protein [Sandaracinaceae bacterium]
MIRRSVFVHLAALLTLLVTGVVHAQIPTALLRRRVVEVRVTGETSGATGADDVGIPVGAPLTRQLLRDAVTRLLATGRWADVQVDAVPTAGGVRLDVELRPRVVITRVDVLGNEALDDDDVRQALGLGSNGELAEGALRGLARNIATEYQDRGYIDAHVALTLRDTDDPSRKVLRARIDEGEPLRVAAYEYDGHPPPQDVDLEEAFGLEEGDVLDRTRLGDGLRTARQALRRAGFLESRLEAPRVRVEGHEATLIVPVRWGLRYTVRIEGHEPLTRQTVEEILELESERLTRRSLSAIDVRVTELLQRHGYHDGEVTVNRVRGERAGTANLVIEMRLGRQLSVVGTSFPGATHFDREYLRDQVISVLEEDLPDTRMFAPVDSDNVDRLGLGGRSVVPNRRQIVTPLSVDPSRVYFAALYDQAVDHLAEVYQAAGYLGARVGPVRLDPVGRGRAVVVIPVFEGPRTLLFEVTIDGNTVLGDRALLESSRFVRGEPFSYLALEEALERMTSLYRERGYLYARIEPEVRFSDDRERAEVVLTVVERFEVHFGAVSIEGNTRTDAQLIRDVLRFAEGDLYRPSRIQQSQDALMALGVFSSVNITPAAPELAERVKPISVVVNERQPQYVDLELGISTGQGFRGAFEYGYRNLAGYAVGVTARLQAGFQFIFQDDELRRNISALDPVDRIERRFSLSFVLPHVEGIDNVRTTLDLIHIRDNQRSFGLDNTGAVLSFNWQPEQPLTFTLSTEAQYNGVQLFGDRDFEDILSDPRTDQQTQRLLRVPEGESFVVSTRLAGSVDQRDSPFVPTEGWFGSTAVEWARTIDIGTQDPEERFFSHFLKITGTLNGYVSIGDVVIAGQLRAGGIVHLEPDSQTYPNRQFFLGGVNSLRGFNQDQLQPQDLAELQLERPELRSQTVLQGGDFFYLVRLEVRFPIYGSLQGGIFADVGNHWANPRAIALSGDCTAQPERCFMRPTAGLGVRIATPVGPLALDYGINLLRREDWNEPVGAFHFSIGVF